MKIKIGYGLIGISLLIFFFVSLHFTNYLIAEIAMAVIGIFLVWKSGGRMLIPSVVFVAAAVVRYFIYNDFWAFLMHWEFCPMLIFLMLSIRQRDILSILC